MYFDPNQRTHSIVREQVAPAAMQCVCVHTHTHAHTRLPIYLPTYIHTYIHPSTLTQISSRTVAALCFIRARPCMLPSGANSHSIHTYALYLHTRPFLCMYIQMQCTHTHTHTHTHSLKKKKRSQNMVQSRAMAAANMREPVIAAVFVRTPPEHASALSGWIFV